MAKKFLLVSKVLEYRSKSDKTNTSRFSLVSPSQNVLINDGEKVQTRNGYTLLGATSADSTPIESSYDWETSTGSVINLRSYDDELEFYVGTVGGVEFNAWTRLKDGWSAVDFSFTTWWDVDEKVDGLIFVNGADKTYSWGGGMASLASTTSGPNTITKNGTTTWAEERFLTGDGKLDAGDVTKVTINGTDYTYTGGEDTTTLTGVGADPTGEAVDSLVFQTPTEHDNIPANNYKADVISVQNNQVFYGSHSSQITYISTNTDFADFTVAAPRVPGNGAILTLDNPVIAFARREDKMYISAGRSDWYRTAFRQLEINAALTETQEIKKLKTGVDAGCKERDLITEVGDDIAFIDNANRFRILSDVENIENVQMPIVSDPVKPDFDAANFTNGHLKAHKQRIYICDPNNDKVWINELRQKADGSMVRFWQPPQLIPIRRFMVRSDGTLHGHSSGAPVTYKLFNGTNDNDASMDATAAFAYRSYGRRDALKFLDEWFTEGYISSNTDLLLTLYYDLGATQTLEFLIEGDNDAILYEAVLPGGLGDTPLGDAPLGDQPSSASTQPKFRIINEFPKEDFFEIQAVYSTTSVDAQWELLATGGDVRLSTKLPINIKIE